jgi:hypothetical protein
MPGEISSIEEHAPVLRVTASRRMPRRLDEKGRIQRSIEPGDETKPAVPSGSKSIRAE